MTLSIYFLVALPLSAFVVQLFHFSSYEKTKQSSPLEKSSKPINHPAMEINS